MGSFTATREGPPVGTFVSFDDEPFLSHVWAVCFSV